MVGSRRTIIDRRVRRTGCGPGIRPTKGDMKKEVTLLRVRQEANRIKKGTGIFDHGQESPHGFLDASYLTSAT